MSEQYMSPLVSSKEPPHGGDEPPAEQMYAANGAAPQSTPNL